MSKLFVIGFNKTATSTLHQVFINNHISSYHGKDWDTQSYQAFSDLANFKKVKWLDSQYPKA